LNTVPSIRRGVLRTQLIWSTLSGLALAVALWLTMTGEVDELFDDSLSSAAELVIGPLLESLPMQGARTADAPSAPVADDAPGVRFVWQLVRHDAGATVLASAKGAPIGPLLSVPAVGFSSVPGWRVYGLASGQDGRMLYVAQSLQERNEAKVEMILTVLLTGLPLLALGLVWSNLRLRRELRPLQDLSTRLSALDPLQPVARLGTIDCAELQPLAAAFDDLVARLSHRISLERAFSAHTAHALRTPLASIEVQLAVALREAPPELRPRLQLARTAASRLQHVVLALLAMFRSGAQISRQDLDLHALAAGLVVEGLELRVLPGAPLQGDADLVSAALLNLLDNAQRHGALQVTLSAPQAGWLCVQDNGAGVGAQRLQALQDAVATQNYEGVTGLGLMLADLVARAHGGRLLLPGRTDQTGSGFTAVLDLGLPGQTATPKAATAP
jgi:signal transduction histidine kinase